MPSMTHTYEEIREVVVSILLGEERVTYNPSQFEHLRLGVIEVFARRSGLSERFEKLPRNTVNDELVRDVFWDLFRQGTITLGSDGSNPNYPFFRLSHFGAQTLASRSPWRFHDTSSYLRLVLSEVPDISDQAIAYLEEASTTFYAECLLATCVMLGVAAEIEFLRLLEVAAGHPTVGTKFQGAASERFMRQKITKFLPVLMEIAKNLDRSATEDIDVNFMPIQSLLRIARNDAGHPSSFLPQRENVYVNLQLFVPFARQLMRIRLALRDYHP